jgi:hypothetical protein
VKQLPINDTLVAQLAGVVLGSGLITASFAGVADIRGVSVVITGIDSSTQSVTVTLTLQVAVPYQASQDIESQLTSQATQAGCGPRGSAPVLSAPVGPQTLLLSWGTSPGSTQSKVLAVLRVWLAPATGAAVRTVLVVPASPSAPVAATVRCTTPAVMPSAQQVMGLLSDVMTLGLQLEAMSDAVGRVSEGAQQVWDTLGAVGDRATLKVGWKLNASAGCGPLVVPLASCRNRQQQSQPCQLSLAHKATVSQKVMKLTVYT